MSRLSIYETRWIDLVFENRNQEYGAYQLRRESVKSSFTALFMGLLFVASLGAIPIISSYFNTDVAPVIAPTEWSEPLEITPVDFQEIEKPKKTVLPEVQSQTTEVPITKEALRDPIIVKPSEANPDIATNKEVVNTTTEPSNGTAVIGVNPTTTSGTGTEIGTETTTKALNPNTIANTTILDKMPEFPGGLDQFYKYVGSNFEKPEIEASGIIKIYVYFVIEKDGTMTDIKVIKDPGYGLGKEAIRVLKSLRAKWTPGIIDSKPVRTAYNLPISVRME